MRKFIIALFLLQAISFSSCEVLDQVSKDLSTIDNVQPAGLSEAEVVQGLKEALRVGTDTAVAVLSKENGFYGDALLRILLPPEADVIVKNKDNVVLKSLGISKMIDDVVLRMNRSAEAASKKAGPIFFKAIQGIRFSDAMDILKGSDTAATHYFRQRTSKQLYDEFHPIVQQYLDEDLVGGLSTSEAWKSLSSAYNKVASYSNSLTPVDVQLDRYVTQKAVSGLFIKIAEQEKLIRKDPQAQVTALLKKVFGS